MEKSMDLLFPSKNYVAKLSKVSTERIEKSIKRSLLDLKGFELSWFAQLIVLWLIKLCIIKAMWWKINREGDGGAL